MIELTRAQMIIIAEGLIEASKWYPEGDTKRRAYETLYEAVKADLGTAKNDEYNQAFADWSIQHKRPNHDRTT